MKTKVCRGCRANLPTDNFYFSKNTRDGCHSYCKLCHSQNVNEKRLIRQFGLSIAEYDEMFCKQASGCAICGKKPTKQALAVDHCHTTGKIRGLLCQQCNCGLGNFKDSPDLLARASYYLEVSDATSDDTEPL